MDLSLEWVREPSTWMISEVDRVIVTFYDTDQRELQSTTRMVGFPQDFLGRSSKRFDFLIKIPVPDRARAASVSFGDLGTPAVRLVAPLR